MEEKFHNLNSGPWKLYNLNYTKLTAGGVRTRGANGRQLTTGEHAGCIKLAPHFAVLSNTSNNLAKSRKSSPFRGFYTFLVLGLQQCGDRSRKTSNKHYYC
jgi:hypothetical protein